VSLAGLLLGVGGVAAMSNGWEMIQVERGWSLFISGAMALAGGTIVIALGQVVARLDELVAVREERKGPQARPPANPAPSENTQPRERVAQAPSAQAPNAPAPSVQPPAPRRQEQAQSEPVEVDRYVSGDVTYVMYSDGAVEVRTPDGAQRYASLAELRAEAASREQ
jgi:hypothetical protein